MVCKVGVKALKFLPDIIISDVMMPRKDGITMTRELRADMTTSHIPIVLLTAKTSIESKLEGWSMERTITSRSRSVPLI